MNEEDWPDCSLACQEHGTGKHLADCPRRLAAIEAKACGFTGILCGWGPGRECTRHPIEAEGGGR